MEGTPRFALIGAAGYVAPRHMKAIKETGGELVAILDPSDSVGVIDTYFPNADYFREFERFDRHLDKLRREGNGIDYVSICSPNYLHDAHIRFALRSGSHAICEKPLVLNPWNLKALLPLEEEAGKRVWTILQLRLHPAVLALKEKIEAEPERSYDVDLTYVTSRGHWYAFSWKGDPAKSGGVATNIGIHFFDMLLWLFGGVVESEVQIANGDCTAGILTLQRAHVRWLLSIDTADLPANTRGRTYRSIKVNNTEVEFSVGFEDLHTASYQSILNGDGFGIHDAHPSVELAYAIREAGR